MEKEKKPGKVSAVRFNIADGGMTSEMTKKYARGGQGGGPDWDEDHITTIHPTMAHAVKHLKEVLGHAFGKEVSSSEE